MNKIKKHSSPILFVLVFQTGIVAMSCNKLVAVNNPVNQLISSDVFTTDKSATSAVDGIYSQMIQSNENFASDALTIYPGLSADEIQNTNTGTDDQFFGNALQATNQTLENIWTSGYSYIYQANAILEGLAQSKTISPATNAQLAGEAKVIRAFCYFYLTNLFGDIPLVTSTTYQTNSVMARSPTGDVYKQMVADLTDAEAALSATYPSSGKVRPNRFTATSLLSRVYLFSKDYPDAESQATAVITSGLYTLEANPDSIFLSGSKEAIWQLLPVQANYNTWEGDIFIPASGTAPNYTLDTSLLNSFEPADRRKTSWVKTTTVNATLYAYPFKYKIRTGSTVLEYYTMLRLAEQYLIRSEARAQLAEYTGSLSDLNTVRERAGLPPLTDTNQSTLLTSIYHEDRIEFLCEWGHRWLDVNRIGQAAVLLPANKPGDNWSQTDALYPIPATEVQRNPSLIQNPGY